MIITMFSVGVGFLLIAAIRSFTHPESAGVTGVIAGVGVVQIVFLFYRNPLRDIGRSISNSQQAKMVVMSYMLGVSLIAKSLKGTATEKEQRALSTLTQQALEQLEQFTEGKLEQKDAKTLRKAAKQPRMRAEVCHPRQLSRPRRRRADWRMTRYGSVTGSVDGVVSGVPDPLVGVACYSASAALGRSSCPTARNDCFRGICSRRRELAASDSGSNRLCVQRVSSGLIFR